MPTITMSLARARSARSHRPLTRPGRGVTTSVTTPVDAVIVPASRGAAALDGAVHLASRLGSTTLVALCSQQTAGSEVLARFADARCRLVVVDVPEGYGHDLMPRRTVAERFHRAGGDRRSDLSRKRNLGLLLARLHDWGKVFFLDDDIGDVGIGLPVDAVHRVTATLDTHQIAGLACDDFPDNSVLCHARRLAGFEQGTFVSGAVLGVNCNDRPLPFFPDLYNEDWFFVSKRAAAGEVGHCGYASQARYDPFATPERARQEEFGDVLAEGLFSLFEEQSTEMDYLSRLSAASAPYWYRFIEYRRNNLSVVGMELEVALDDGTGDAARLTAALRSLDAAADQLARVSPDLCVDYLDAWIDDLAEWERATQRLRVARDTAEAMDHLALRQWHCLGDQIMV